jgi:hypothetical protein
MPPKKLADQSASRVKELEKLLEEERAEKERWREDYLQTMDLEVGRFFSGFRF